MMVNNAIDALHKRLNKYYHNEKYVIQQKAFVFVCMLILLIVIECVSLVFNTFSIRQSTPVVMVFFNLIFITLSILFLVMAFRGHYTAAANISCAVFFIVMMAFSLFRMDYYFKFGVNPSLVIFFLVLAFSSFFGSMIMFISISLPVLLYQMVIVVIGLFVIPSNLSEQYYSYSMNSSITFIGLIAFLYLSRIITNIALEKTDFELVRNRDLTHTLEEKVKVRTEDLGAALREIELSNEELIRIKNSLWGEMRIAKKLQTLLLPSAPKLEGYALSTYIKPAAEVGGDYYDIINEADKDWIVIGDVSGHGVPAGLVMMMIHTSLHTIIQDGKNLSPAQILTQVNNVVSEYMNRIDQSKYMTITLMCHQGSGRFTFSGLHLPILIYRKKTDSVEQVDTSGTWIGLNFGLGSHFYNEEFTMEQGDIMLLYTDGITESWITDITKGSEHSELHFFGKDPLSRILTDMKDGSPDDIRRRIIDELSIYEQKDDVTFVVIKKTS